MLAWSFGTVLLAVAAAKVRLATGSPGLWADTNWLLKASSKIGKNDFIFLTGYKVSEKFSA
jgi:hypothetical protein